MAQVTYKGFRLTERETHVGRGVLVEALDAETYKMAKAAIGFMPSVGLQIGEYDSSIDDLKAEIDQILG